MPQRSQFQYQGKVEPFRQPVVGTDTPSWFAPLSEPVRTRVIAAALIAPAFFFTQAVFDEVITPDKWFQNLSEPVRIKPGLRAPLHPFYFAEPSGQTQPESVTYDRWGFAWSEPSVKGKIGLRASLQQTLAWNPNITFPEAITEDRWHQPWSEPPVKHKLGLNPALQQFDPLQVPVLPPSFSFLVGYNWWSEPVKLPIGLKAWHQQFLAYHPRLLPTPNVTATLAATETGQDTALIGINVTDSTASTTAGEGARVSLRETAPDGDDAAVSGRET